MAFPRVTVLAAAALTTFDGQAVFEISTPSGANIDRLFRLRRGSRLLAEKAVRS
jgi:hypothetical protein